jgi:hypothetical protein
MFLDFPFKDGSSRSFRHRIFRNTAMLQSSCDAFDRLWTAYIPGSGVEHSIFAMIRIRLEAMACQFYEIPDRSNGSRPCFAMSTWDSGLRSGERKINDKVTNSSRTL